MIRIETSFIEWMLYLNIYWFGTYYVCSDMYNNSFFLSHCLFCSTCVCVSYSQINRDVRPRGLASASRPKNLASASASASWVVASASASASWVLASASWVLASSLEASRGQQPKRNGMWLEVNQSRILRSLSCRCESQASLIHSVKTFIHKNIWQPNLQFSLARWSTLRKNTETTPFSLLASAACLFASPVFLVSAWQCRLPTASGCQCRCSCNFIYFWPTLCVSISTNVVSDWRPWTRFSD